MTALQLEFALLDRRYALTQLPPRSLQPTWAYGQFVAIINSTQGVTVVCEQHAVPEGLTSRTGFRCLEIVGAFDLTSVGIVAAASGSLASAGVSLFAYSTWQTDYILVHEDDLDTAIAALTAAGHKVHNVS